MCTKMKSLEAQSFFEYHITLFAIFILFAIIIIPACRLVLNCNLEKRNVFSLVSKFTSRHVAKSKLEMSLLFIALCYLIYSFILFFMEFCFLPES